MVEVERADKRAAQVEQHAYQHAQLQVPNKISPTSTPLAAANSNLRIETLLLDF